MTWFQTQKWDNNGLANMKQLQAQIPGTFSTQLMIQGDTDQLHMQYQQLQYPMWM